MLRSAPLNLNPLHSRVIASCIMRSCIFERVGDWLHPCVFPFFTSNASVSPYAVSYLPRAGALAVREAELCVSHSRVPGTLFVFAVTPYRLQYF